MKKTTAIDVREFFDTYGIPHYRLSAKNSLTRTKFYVIFSELSFVRRKLVFSNIEIREYEEDGYFVLEVKEEEEEEG